MGHSCTNILQHIVCGTKHRLPHITDDRRERMDACIGGVLKTHGCQLLAAGGMPDHSHWLILMRPSRATADIVRELKAQSSGWFRDAFDATFKRQRGYGGFSVSESGAAAIVSTSRAKRSTIERCRFRRSSRRS